jgi:UDP-2-acetamido-3-amino-2,3-dideoxy-glucuronate N-acetyltransferase
MARQQMEDGAAAAPVLPTPAIAVVGCGNWGRNLVRNFAGLGALRAVCDADQALRPALQAQYPGLTVASSLDRLLDDPDIRAFVVATPASQHAMHARQCLEAGKDVFVEKPLALDVKEARELADLAERRGRILMVGHLLRYHPGIRRLKALVAEGALGRIQYVYSNRLNLGRFRTEENILWSFAPHDISVLLHLLDEYPSHIQAHGASYLHPDRVDATVTTLQFPSGVAGHLFVSWLHPYKEQKLVVVGEQGMAVFDDVSAGQKLTLFRHTVEWVDRVPVPRRADGCAVPVGNDEPLAVECRHFLECVRDRTRPLTDAREGIAVLEVLTACQQSLDAKAPPPASSPPSRPYVAHETAVIDEPCQIGEGTRIWHFSHVMAGARIGRRCNLGQNVVVSPEVRLGDNVKVQNNVSLYTGVILEDDVFCGPSMVFTNVINPRSHIVRRAEYQTTLVRRGATLGANCTIRCGVIIGRHAFVGAGAVVTKDVPDFALVVGNPGRAVGWMCRCGHRIVFPPKEDTGRCAACQAVYQRTAGIVAPVDPDPRDSV